MVLWYSSSCVVGRVKKHRWIYCCVENFYMSESVFIYCSHFVLVEHEISWGCILKAVYFESKPCKSCCFGCIERGFLGWMGLGEAVDSITPWQFQLSPSSMLCLLTVCWGWGNYQQGAVQEGDEKVRDQKEVCQSRNPPRRTVLSWSCPG